MAKRLGIAYAAGKPSRLKDFPQAGSQGGNLWREKPQSKKLKKKKKKKKAVICFTLQNFSWYGYQLLNISATLQLISHLHIRWEVFSRNCPLFCSTELNWLANSLPYLGPENWIRFVMILELYNLYSCQAKMQDYHMKLFQMSRLITQDNRFFILPKRDNLLYAFLRVKGLFSYWILWFVTLFWITHHPVLANH